MPIIADLHCHTIASTHAYSTMQEMITAAAQKGHCAIAITDHSSGMPGSSGTWYFKNMDVLPRSIDGIRLLKGIESNVCAPDGYLDENPAVLDTLDWVIASMHDETFHHFQYNLEACTQAWLNVAKNPQVNLIGHCGTEQFKFDYKKVIPEFVKHGKLVEINNNSFRVRRGTAENCKQIALICKKHRVPVVLTSDAHCSYQVGEVALAEALLKGIDFPEDLIINKNKDRFEKYLIANFGK